MALKRASLTKHLQLKVFEKATVKQAEAAQKAIENVARRDP